MPGGTASAFALIRVGRGQPPPTAADLHAAIARDRERLHVAAQNPPRDLAVAGPYQIIVEGKEFDEYVVWER